MPAQLSLSLTVVVLTLLGSVVVTSVFGARISLRPLTEETVPLPADWKNVFTMLASVVEDDDFQDSLREFLRGAGGTKANYCRMHCILCDETLQVVGLNFTDVVGTIVWASLPKGVLQVTVQNSVIKETFDLSQLPYWVKSVRLRNVSYFPGIAKFRKRQMMLQNFECVRCGLTEIQWEQLPSLVSLDLSLNPSLRPFDLAALPPTLRMLNLSWCNVSISAGMLQALPPPLTVLDLSHNRFKGSVIHVVFPSGLEVLRLEHNELAGEVHMDNFPFTLVVLDLSNNALHGEISDASAFLALKTLSVAHNGLTAVHWDKLPTALEVLNVSYNLLEGRLDLSLLPSTLTVVDVSHNALTGPINLAVAPPAVATLDVSYNRFSGPVDLTRLSNALRFVYLQHNRLEGTPDLTNLPVDLRRILIFENAWDSLMPPLYL